MGGLGGAVAEIDIGAQLVERHAALAIPLHARDLGAAQPARTVDADAERAQPHRRLHRALHGAAERDAPLELLCDAVGDVLGVDLGLADLDDVEADLAVGHLGDVEAQLLDVGALLADDDAGARRVDGDARLLGGALDDDAADAGLLQPVVQELAQTQILVQQPAILLAREPARIPGPVDAEPEPDRVDLLTHYFFSSSRSRTTTDRLAKYFSTCAARPRPRAWKRFKVNARPTVASLTKSLSTSGCWLFSALAIAACSTFFTSLAIRRGEKLSSASARLAFLPRLICAPRFSLRALTRSARA